MKENYGKIASVNISEKRGTIKHPVSEINIDRKGVIGDAHYDASDRHLSLISIERVEEFSKEINQEIKPGEFAENITLSGIDLSGVKLHDCFKAGSVKFEVIQIGKPETYTGDGKGIFRIIGKSVMLHEGIFCRVISGGILKAGDEIELCPAEKVNEFDSRAKTWDLDVEKLNRARKVAGMILQKLSARSVKRAFEYGCGTGLLSLCLRQNIAQITCADSSPGMLEVLRGKIDEQHIDNIYPLEIDLAGSSIAEGNFDAVYSMLTLHHVMDIERIMDAFYKMLEPGGCLFVADLEKEDGSFHGEGFVGHNGFERESLKSITLKRGFKNVSFESAFEIVKEIADGSKKIFPGFLMCAEK